MPLIESQPDALAQVYARSLFELAEARGGQPLLEHVLAELEEILDLSRRDHRFSEFLASRILSASARAASLRRIFSSSLQPLTLNFLLLLNEKGRLSHLPAVVAAFDALAQKRFGRVEIDLFTPAPLSSAELDHIKARLSKAIGKQAVVHPYTDHSMIGGVRLRIDDRLIDASIASQLRRLREILATRGPARVRAIAERAIDDSVR